MEGSGGDRRSAAAPPAAPEAERFLPICQRGDRTHEQESAGRRAVGGGGGGTGDPSATNDQTLVHHFLGLYHRKLAFPTHDVVWWMRTRMAGMCKTAYVRCIV